MSALQAHSGAGGARGRFGRRPDPAVAPGSSRRAPLLTARTTRWVFPPERPLGSCSGSPALVRSARGKYTRKRRILGENCSLAAARSTRSTGWTPALARRSDPRAVSIDAWYRDPVPAQRTFRAPLGRGSRTNRSAPAPSGSAGRAGSAGTEIAGVGSRSQRSPERRGHCAHTPGSLCTGRGVCVFKPTRAEPPRCEAATEALVLPWVGG